MAGETIRVIADKEDIVAIADAVRSKTGSTDEMTLDGIVSGINSIETGGGAVATITLATTQSYADKPAVYYVNENGEAIINYSTSSTESGFTVGSYNILVPQIVILDKRSSDAEWSVSGSISQLYVSGVMTFYYVTGNCTITHTGGDK